MKPQDTLASSFTFFHSIEDPQFLQYLETYCSSLDKREKQILQTSKNWTLFMEEDLPQTSRNGFSKNLSRPSFNCFDFKDYVGSIQNIPRYSIKRQSLELIVKNEVQCKIEEEESQEENVRYQEIKKAETKDEKKAKRVDEIMLIVNEVQKQIQKLMQDFDP